MERTRERKSQRARRARRARVIERAIERARE